MIGRRNARSYTGKASATPPVRSGKSTIDNAINAAKRDQMFLQLTKAARLKQIGVIVGIALPTFSLLEGRVKAFENMQSFDPETHATFGIFVDKYEDCLNQAINTGGNPDKDAMHALVDSMFNFAIDLTRDASGQPNPKDEAALNRGRYALHAKVTAHYLGL